MAKKTLFPIFLVGLFITLVSSTFALEKVKLGSSFKIAPVYYLLVLAAEEKGFWKDNGLDVEWVPFVATTPHVLALASGVVKIGISSAFPFPDAGERGLAVVMVGQYATFPAFDLWVRTDSPYRKVEDLQGGRIGIVKLGDPPHMYGRIITRAHGIEKNVRYVAVGGVLEQMAGLRAGAYEAMVQGFTAVAGLKVQGIIRQLAAGEDYLPKPWLGIVVVARIDFAKSQPDVVKKLLRAILQASSFVRTNPSWSVKKIMSLQSRSEQEATVLYDATRFTTTLEIDRKAVESFRKVHIEYGLMTEKAPKVDDLFTNEYLP